LCSDKIKQVVPIAIDPSALAASLSEIMANLPVILGWLQTITYILLVLFFGSIAVIGFRIYAPFWKKLLIRVVFGFLSLFSGAAIAGFMPLPDNILIKLVQIDLLIGGVVSSIIFAVSLYILSKALNSEDTIKRAIERLQAALKKELARPKPKSMWSSPFFLAGVVIIALFLIFSAANFRGFPSFQDSLMDTFGMTPEDFESLGDVLDNVKDMNMPEGIADMPSECLDLLSAIGRSPESMTELADYTNPTLKSIIESSTGQSVLDMKRTSVQGGLVIVAITSEGQTCIASETELCICR
jgi:hypothetical protein